MTDLRVRPGTPADSPALFQVFVAAFADLNQRLNLETAFTQPAFVEQFWQRTALLWDYLAHTESRFFVAERNGQIIGYARSIDRDGVRQLTEFFVHPDSQSAGVGRALLALAFPAEGIGRRLIIASSDSRAQSLYLKSGVFSRFPIQYFYSKPEPVYLASDLFFASAADTPDIRAALDRIDRAVLGFTRSQEHTFLLADRACYLLYRGGEVVGYTYTGKSTGPIALLDPGEFPAVLAYAENAGAERGDPNLGIQVPVINRAAVDYLLERGFHMDPLPSHFMSNEPLVNLDRYICTSPPFFI